MGCSSVFPPIDPSTAFLTRESIDPSLVLIHHADLWTTCFGFAVDPETILTARHCLAPFIQDGTSGGPDCASRFDRADIGTLNLVPLSEAWSGRGRSTYAARSVLVPSCDGYCECDVALLTVDQKHDLRPVALALDEPIPGTKYFSPTCGAIGAFSQVDRISERDWVGNGLSCSGDSGAPAFDQRGEVIGILSRADISETASIYMTTTRSLLKGLGH